MTTTGTKVLSIVGPGRSGSTLLAAILGEIPGFFDMGEVRWIWRHGVRQGRVCGCGQPPVRCPIWSRVLAATLGELPSEASAESGSRADRIVADVAEAETRLGRRGTRRRAVAESVRPELRWPEIDLVRRTRTSLLEAVAAATGARVLVDASKRPFDAALLVSVPTVEQFVVHLVRDPRAVAYSWGRVKNLPSGGTGPDQMARRGSLSAADRWAESHLGTRRLRRHVPENRWLLLRYEDFVADPVGAIRGIGTLVGEEIACPVSEDGVVTLGEHHTVAGNPIRFHRGPLNVQADDEWLVAMSPRTMGIVTAATLPFLSGYGYPLRPRATQGSGRSIPFPR